MKKKWIEKIAKLKSHSIYYELINSSNQPLSSKKEEIRKKAKIRNRYNKAPNPIENKLDKTIVSIHILPSMSYIVVPCLQV